MAFVKGHNKFGGRMPGVRNKTTRELCEIFDTVFEMLDGIEGMCKWVMRWDDNRKEFYNIKIAHYYYY